MMAIYSVTFEVEAALLDDAPVLAMVAESKFRRHCERQGITIDGPIEWAAVRPPVVDGRPMLFVDADGCPQRSQYGVVVSASAHRHERGA
jgi:hypothetical protein